MSWGGGIPELWPEYAVQTVSGISIEPAEGGYRVHGTATANANIWVKANLEAGAAYLASLSSTSPDVTAQVYRSGQTVTVKDGAPKRFEAVGGEYHLYVKVDAGRTVDAIARPSLIRIGDAGGGTANLVGRAPVTVHKTADSDVVEVGEGGVRYSVANDYSGTFAVLDLEPGAYRLDRGEYIGFAISSVQSKELVLNPYYTAIVGADMYAGNTTSLSIVLPEPGKLGFSLPQGDGVMHPSIVRVL